MGSTRGQQTRGRIAAAALGLLQEKGPAGLTMRQVAARTGLALSNVQYHYGSREALLVGITDHHLALCRDALVRGVGTEPPTLRRVLQVSLCDAGVQNTAPPFRQLFALAAFEPAVRDRLDAHYAEALQGLIALLGAPSDASPADVEEVATVLLTAMEGFYLLSGATPVSGARLAARLEAMATRAVAETQRGALKPV